MTNYDEQLKQLRQQVSRKQHLEKTLRELHSQREPLLRKVQELESIKISEQADVDRLEGRSLAAFFYNVVGKMDEKLDQERQEAYAAAVKYDAAARELDSIDEDIERHRAELLELNDCEARYDKLLAEKQAALKAAGGTYSEEIKAIESRITYLEHQMDEVDEAIAAGKRALSCADSVLDSLGSAENWSTFDLFSDSILTDIAKHNHLDNAQHKIEQLQVALRRFKTELADVGSIRADMHVSIDGFLRFADYFFDNLFTDWAVRDKISQSKSQVNHTVSQIQSVLCKLDGMMDADQAEWKQLHDELDELVLKAQL